MPDRPLVGRTRDGTFEVGARRTFDLGLSEAWELLMSPHGLRLWFDRGFEGMLVEGTTYELSDGTTGTVRVFVADSHLRVTWQPPAWEHTSTIQVRVMPRGDRTTIVFHQERMPNAAARTERLALFKAALDALEQDG